MEARLQPAAAAHSDALIAGAAAAALPKLGPPPTIRPARWRHVLNESLQWAEASVPAFECSDADVTLTYWYRWRLFHLHMRRGDKLSACSSPLGCWVLTEFLRKVFWSGPHNTIVAPAGHHIMEGRWLRDDTVIDDYARFWFLGSGWKKQYTFWPAHALWQRSLLLRRSAAEGVTGELFPQLAANYRDWQRTHYSQKAGCIFQSCHADGQENSAGLDGCRPTVTAAQYGEASALAAIAAALHNSTEAAFFRAEAAKWQGVLQGRLWSEELGFFVTEAQPPPPNLHAELRRMGRLGRMREVQTYFGCLACDRRRACPPGQGWPEGKRVGVRELMGLTSPWYFSAVPRGSKRVAAYAEAFSQLDDPAGFGAKWGPRTTERRNSACYNFSNRAQCNWNGGVWPYETCKAGTALVNLLHLYPAQRTATRATFQRLLVTYARAHTRSHAEGLSPPHVDEDLHPDDGYWITRRKLHGIAPWPGTGGLGGARDPLRARGTHYFHSTFNDLVLSGVVGIRATEGCLEVAPLTHLGWWLVRKVRLRGRELDVLYDETGDHYHLGAGLHVWLDGAHVGSAPALPAEDPPSGGAVGGDHAQSAALVVPPRVRLAWDSPRFVRCRGTLSSPTPEEWWEC